MNQSLKLQTEAVCKQLFGMPLSEASRYAKYASLSCVLRSRLEELYARSQEESDRCGKKHIYYLSMEFLMGTSMRNVLFQLGLTQEAERMMKEVGVDLKDIADIEPDPGLGNGGLGRLAACYLDAASSRSLPFTGFSIKYEFGIFRQKIVDGWQVEFPDEWLERGEVWLRARREDAVEVRFGGTVEGFFSQDGYSVSYRDYQAVVALPYDLFVPGYGGEFCNALTLWEAKSRSSFDMAAFSRGEYVKALEDQTMAEVITKVLYPADNHIEGKRLRLRQQYFFVSASLQSILRTHLRKHRSIASLPEYVGIHLNDTHPALAVPELMRLLLDEHKLSWDEAWELTGKVITYTNHTVMSEAMERWNLSLYRSLLPRIAQITEEIDRRTREEHIRFYGNDRAKIDYMAVICGDEVRMVNMCLAAAHGINGVSALHSEILRKQFFRDYAVMKPDSFQNITNGIAYRRWLCIANPSLAALLDDTIGVGYRTDAAELEKLLKYQDDDTILEHLRQIKHTNKVALSNYIAAHTDQLPDPHSLFDVQVKRLHEYKRQLLSALRILHRYLEIKEAPSVDYLPTTYVFAAKASSGYLMAKQILRLIVTISRMIAQDPQVRDRMRVVFLEDYNVSLAEKIMPAAELSEQISLAGKEASGTGNMKMMLNGAITVGTMDGANVEIFEKVGLENGFLFGLRSEEADELKRNGYRPSEFIARSEDLKRVIEFLSRGFLGYRFDEILGSLLRSDSGSADPYMNLADFDDYLRARKDADLAYRDKRRFSRMSLVNIANAGVFSADRAIGEYERKMWGIQ